MTVTDRRERETERERERSGLIKNTEDPNQCVSYEHADMGLHCFSPIVY